MMSIKVIVGNQDYHFNDAEELVSSLRIDSEILSQLNPYSSKCQDFAQESGKFADRIKTKKLSEDSFEDSNILGQLQTLLTNNYTFIPGHGTAERDISNRIYEIFGSKARAGAAFYLKKMNSPVSQMDSLEAGGLFAAVCHNEGLSKLASENFAEVVRSGSNQLDQTIAKQEAEFKRVSKYNEEELKDYEKRKELFQKIEQFDIPYKFWRNKARYAKGVAIFLFFITFAIGTSLACYLVGEVGEIENKLIEVASLRDTDNAEKTGTKPDVSLSDLKNLSYAHYIPYILPITILGFSAIWFIRVLLKLAFNQWHVGTDAAERATLIQTWLAMNEGESPPSEREREFMMAQIFRHVPTGLIEQDTVPQTPITFLQSDA